MAVGTEVHFANQNMKGLQNKTTNKSVYSNKDSIRQIAIKVDIGNHRYTNYIILDGLEGDTRIYCPRC